MKVWKWRKCTSESVKVAKVWKQWKCESVQVKVWKWKKWWKCESGESVKVVKVLKWTCESGESVHVKVWKWWKRLVASFFYSRPTSSCWKWWLVSQKLKAKESLAETWMWSTKKNLDWFAETFLFFARIPLKLLISWLYIKPSFAELCVI